MSDAPLHFLFGIHNHQPVGNFEGVVDDAILRAYHPFLQAIAETGAGLSLTVHCSGGLLATLKERARPTFDLLGRLVADGQVELLTGGFYEPILALLPDWDKVGQIQALTQFIKSSFGVTARGMWLAERIWEPQLPRILREAGVEFVLVDDSHFALAGLDPETLGGYYLTEEQGASVAVFPINQRLRYLVPFADPAESVRYLETRRGAGAVTMVDDGEKFGVWPGTDRLVYGERWLARFLDALRATPWLRVSTFSRFLDTEPPAGRVYLPTAAYTEMGEWALPPAAAAELHDARARLAALPDGERLSRLLRGGFFRNFLIKYPEIGDAYWKMIRLSRRVHEGLTARPRDPRLLAARERLWQGQANDAYWHGVFGGCYLPHLRRAVKSALIGCERRLEGPGKPLGLDCVRADIDGDGVAEVVVRTRSLGLTLRPARGGSLTELLWLGGEMDAADVLTRRPEPYHRQVAERPSEAGADEVRTIHSAPAVKEAGLTALLRYDRFRRASLLDGLFPPEGELDPLDPWDAARLVVGERPLEHEVKTSPREVGAAVLAPASRRPADGGAEVRGGHGRRCRGDRDLSPPLGRGGGARGAVGGAVEPHAQRGRRARPLLPRGGPPVARQPRAPRRRARPRHGGRVARLRARAPVGEPRRHRVGAGGDGVAVRDRLRAHLPGIRAALRVAAPAPARADVGDVAARGDRRNRYPLRGDRRA